MQTLYPLLLTVHNWLRWLAVLLGLAATFFAFANGSSTDAAKRFRFSKFFVITMDVQFLVGLILYLGVSPVVRQAFQNFGAAMKVRELRFFAAEHSVLMLLAVVLAHVGGVLMRKSKLQPAKARGAAICFALSVIAMLGGMPWFRPLLRLG